MVRHLAGLYDVVWGRAKIAAIIVQFGSLVYKIGYIGVFAIVPLLNLRH